MQFEKKATIGNFAKKGEDFKEGDVLTILNEGAPVEGKFGTQHVFKMRMVNGEEKNLPFNQTSINKMIDVFGKESKTWIGKKVKVWMITQNVSGEFKKVVYLTAPNQSLEEDKEDVQTHPKEKAIQVGDDPNDKEDINPDEIPF